MKIKTLLTKLKKERSGQSLVELALSLTIMLTLLLGAIEIGLTTFQYMTIRDAAQEGASYAALHPTVADEANIDLHVRDAADDVFSDTELAKIVVTVTRVGVCEGSTTVNSVTTVHNITVTVKYVHNIIFPLIGPLLGVTTIPLTATSTSTILQPTCP